MKNFKYFSNVWRENKRLMELLNKIRDFLSSIEEDNFVREEAEWGDKSILIGLFDGHYFIIHMEIQNEITYISSEMIDDKYLFEYFLHAFLFSEEDINRLVSNLYKSTTISTEYLLSKVDEIELSKENYEELKDMKKFNL